MQERIAKILSSHGFTSRRNAERMILEGRVTVNGSPATIGQRAEFGIDIIEIDNVPLSQKPGHLYIMLNKPRGYVTSMSDNLSRKTVINLLDGIDTRVYPIGRLDINTSGLLLLTNDGQFANSVMHPSFLIPKTYDVLLSGDISRAAAQLRKPTQIEGHTVHAVSVRVLKKTDFGGILRITIIEGRNRQIRKMCSVAGLETLSLKRISIGSVTLGSLRSGEWRYLSKDELTSLSHHADHQVLEKWIL